MQSGLYNELSAAGRIVKHEEVNTTNFAEYITDNQKILLPEQIPFISYPYEWSFDMWKDAAVVTLKIVQIALQKEMILKDATPFNIQFNHGRPVFIDTLSFEKYENGKPWIAYHQFCECFLSPLLLMHYGHRDLGKLIMVYPDGIPLEIVKSLLPAKSTFNIHVYMHIWMQAKVALKNVNKKEIAVFFAKNKLETLLKGLLEFVSGLTTKKDKSTWDDYYTQTILGNDYLESKRNIVADFSTQITFNSVLDLGFNDGYFSMVLKNNATNVIAVDFDSNCINE